MSTASSRLFLVVRQPHNAEARPNMVWFFERDEECLNVETRYDNDTREYVVIVRYADGREETERFTDPQKYRVRLLALENRLETDRWLREGPPMLLPDGWPNKPPR